MKNKLTLSLLLLIFLSSCEKKVNVTIEYRDYDYNGSTIEEYFYAEGPMEFDKDSYEDQEGYHFFGTNGGYRFSEKVYWKDKTPQDLGYTGSTGTYISSHARTTPGANGYWANNTLDYHGNPAPSGGGGGGGCTNPYQSPTPNDAQLNALCQAAYTYRCDGYDSQADLTCAQYNSLTSTGTNVPACSYCN